MAAPIYHFMESHMIKPDIQGVPEIINKTSIVYIFIIENWYVNTFVIMLNGLKLSWTEELSFSYDPVL